MLKELELNCEQLTAAYILADATKEREALQLNRLEQTLAREGANMNCGDFMQLQARVAQARARVEAAETVARDKKAALDSARSAETHRMQKELAQRAYDGRLKNFENAKEKLAAHREQLSLLHSTTPALENEFNQALASLDVARSALPRN